MKPETTDAPQELRERLLVFLGTVGASTPDDHPWVAEARSLADAVNARPELRAAAQQPEPWGWGIEKRRDDGEWMRWDTVLYEPLTRRFEKDRDFRIVPLFRASPEPASGSQPMTNARLLQAWTELAAVRRSSMSSAEIVALESLFAEAGELSREVTRLRASGERTPLVEEIARFVENRDGERQHLEPSAIAQDIRKQFGERTPPLPQPEIVTALFRARGLLDPAEPSQLQAIRNINRALSLIADQVRASPAPATPEPVSEGLKTLRSRWVAYREALAHYAAVCDMDPDEKLAGEEYKDWLAHKDPADARLREARTEFTKAAESLAATTPPSVQPVAQTKEEG